MKTNYLKSLALSAAMLLSLAACNKNNESVNPDNNVDTQRWITVAGALMQTTPGDGNGGTMVYAVSYEDARNPDFAINVYDNGFPVKSNRTARLQSSEDGNTLFNIAYTGDNGGEFSRYKVNGGANFVQEDVSVNIAQYASTSPRWAKLFDGDKTGIAVNVANIIANNAPNGANPGGTFQYYRGTATVLALDLQNVLISRYKQYQIPLTAEEEALGHNIFRLDAPVLNKAGNKLIIGTWMQKRNPATGQTESNFQRLGTKSVVVDYPSLENPTVITSTVGQGDCSGYRSFNSFTTEDGNIYQATQREPSNRGSHILKINANNEYDNNYVFSLNTALGVSNVYVDCWRYAGNGIAYALYSHGDSDQGFVARLDLNARTATKVDIPEDADLNFGQYQGILVNGDEVYIAITPIGKDGNIYIINSRTGAITKGAKLVNKPGNRYIGIF
ncbi:hypothetical protein [Eisenibacter elegans]|jgi:hypothetical protein|uniref:hypothetical protein n=1 Tax=Eisenibacter elegans TaxID=997 RepID=UPI0004100BBF|nr:hypothetical protein [Eisenibacter elegans]